ncbi:MAG TPA: hypothetical protein VGO11_11295 [Chthoniobacteraceae bacterium]|jgi:hypothetical protein|nr:hypothetical protein [Chthoniobacteraceae bacterium]
MFRSCDGRARGFVFQGWSLRFLLKEIHQFIETRGRNEVGRRFEMRLDVFEEDGVAEAADCLLAEAGIRFPITKVPFRKIADVIATQQIRTNGTGGVFHLRLPFRGEVDRDFLALHDEGTGAGAVDDVLDFGFHGAGGSLRFSSSCIVDAR